MQEVDLLIIGSGPAGLSTALHLLQRDASWAKRMILLEKSAHPRPKLCGGGVTRIGLETLCNLGLRLPLPIPGVEIEEARFVYQDHAVHVRGQPEFVVYNRSEFDAFLSHYARQQGAKIHENETVQTIDLKPEGAAVTTSQDTYSAKVIVGADGSKGVTRRLIKKYGSQGDVARVIETITPAQETQAPFAEGYAIFDLTPCRQGLQGYFWEFPSKVGDRPSFNRGVYDARIASSRERADLPAILESQVNHDHDNQSEVSFQGHPVHWFHPRNRFALPHMLLVGDAAGVDPLFGEGIGPALAYGKLAAEVISDAFRKDDYSFRDYKSRLFSSAVGRYLLTRWLVAWLGYHLSWSRTFMYALLSVGKLAAAWWPKPEPLYFTGNPKRSHFAGD